MLLFFEHFLSRHGPLLCLVFFCTYYLFARLLPGSIFNNAKNARVIAPKSKKKNLLKNICARTEFFVRVAEDVLLLVWYAFTSYLCTMLMMSGGLFTRWGENYNFARSFQELPEAHIVFVNSTASSAQSTPVNIEQVFSQFVVCQCCFYLSTLPILFVSPAKKNRRELAAHHIITIVLIVCGYSLCSERICIVVLLLHDICDVLLQVSSICNRFESSLRVLFFGAFTVAHGFLRCVLFPLLTMTTIIHNYLERYQEPFVRTVTLLGLSSLILLLTCLHWTWLFQCIRKISQFLKGNIREATKDPGDSKYTQNKQKKKFNKEKLK